LKSKIAGLSEESFLDEMELMEDVDDDENDYDNDDDDSDDETIAVAQGGNSSRL